MTTLASTVFSANERAVRVQENETSKKRAFERGKQKAEKVKSDALTFFALSMAYSARPLY